MLQAARWVSASIQIASCLLCLAAVNLLCQMEVLQMNDHGHLADRYSTLALLQFDEEAAEKLGKAPCGTNVPFESQQVHILHLVGKQIYVYTMWTRMESGTADTPDMQNIWTPMDLARILRQSIFMRDCFLKCCGYPWLHLVRRAPCHSFKR